jgi:hypothetical protein
VYLYTGRRAVPIGTFTAGGYDSDVGTPMSSAVLDSIADVYHPDLVIASWALSRFAAEKRTVQPGMWLRPVDSIGTTVVYARVVP